MLLINYIFKKGELTVSLNDQGLVGTIESYMRPKHSFEALEIMNI